MAAAPRFTFRTHGRICAGEEWIYADDTPIARLCRAAVGQPEQNLRYFNSVLNPVELRDLRLRPGDRPLFAGVQLYWKLGPVITSELVGLEVDGDGTEALRLTAITRDPGGVATSTRVVTVSHDAALDSLVYDVQCGLEIHSPEVFDTPQARASGPAARFEYCDPWYCDIPAPSVAFTGAWPKRYSRLLATAADGRTWQMPLNHMATGIPTPATLAPGALLVLAHEPGADPAIEFVGATAPRSGFSICNWGYDVHLHASYPWDALYAPITEHFRLRLCPDAVAADLARRAAPVPAVVYADHTELPLYERHTSFARGLRLDQPSPGPTDAWPWLPSGPGAAWCRDYGRSDLASLKISRDAPGPTEWTMDREGDGAWTQRWTPHTGFRVRGYLRTAGVTGRGACLGLRWKVYNAPDRYPLVCSRRLQGTQDWTLVEAALSGPPPDISGVCLVYRQDGPGTSWLDDLEVTVL